MLIREAADPPDAVPTPAWCAGAGVGGHDARRSGRAPGADHPVVEADAPNELWTGDALHGPLVAGRKTYLFAFIDDHSRAVMGHRWGFAEDTVRLAAALRPALAARGSRATSTSTTAPRSWIPGCCGPARNPASSWCTPPRGAHRAGARSSDSSAP
ncbi:DDE-type integrase/transposase/recombinase [Streptomyces sp. NPDC093149]|uniref:DDE-type integrase/transposase/recombinase n=1 Tax=Streptomyces sp. NPDC093149 TaxID=3366031 RepID=UPI0038249EAD